MTIVLHLVFLMLYKRIVVNWQAIQVTKRRVSVLTNLGKAMVCRWLRRGFRDHATPSGGAHYVEAFLLWPSVYRPSMLRRVAAMAPLIVRICATEGGWLLGL